MPVPSPDSIRFIIVLVPLILLVIGVWKPLYAAIAYMVVVYCKTANYYPIFIDLRVEVVLPIIVLARIMLDPNSIKKSSFSYNQVSLYFYLFALCIGCSYIFAWNYKVAWDNGVYHFVQMAFLYLMLIMSLDTEHDIKEFVWAFVMMFAYLAYEPVYGFITKTGAAKEMFGDVFIAEVGILSGHVALANNMNQMIPISLFLILSIEKKYKKAIAAIPLMIFFVALMASASRGGVLGFLFFGVITVFFSKQRLKIGLIVGAITIVLFSLSETFSSTLARVDYDQTYGRFTGLSHGLEMIYVFGHILGVGPGCFALARGAYFGHTMDAHNIYGQLFGELGIPGAIIWFLLIGYTIFNLVVVRKTLREMGNEKTFLFYLATGLLVSLLVRLFISMGSHGLYLFYWYVIGAMSAVMMVIVKGKAHEPASDQKRLNPS